MPQFNTESIGAFYSKLQAIMKKILHSLVCTIPFLFISGFCSGQDHSAKDIVRKADEKFNGENSKHFKMSMTIIRPTWKRTVDFKNWSLGREYALTLITCTGER